MNIKLEQLNLTWEKKKANKKKREKQRTESTARVSGKFCYFLRFTLNARGGKNKFFDNGFRIQTFFKKRKWKKKLSQSKCANAHKWTKKKLKNILTIEHSKEVWAIRELKKRNFLAWKKCERPRLYFCCDIFVHSNSFWKILLFSLGLERAWRIFFFE